MYLVLLDNIQSYRVNNFSTGETTTIMLQL